MRPDLERFDRLLDAALADPARAPDFFFATADLKAANDRSQHEVLRHLDATLSRIALPKATRAVHSIGALFATPDGVVSHIAPNNSDWLAAALPGGAAIGERLTILDRTEFQDAFNIVASGQAVSQWRDFEGGKISFAAPLKQPEGQLKPERIVVLVAGAAPNPPSGPLAAIPISTARMLRLLSPATPKSPKEWLVATPPRKIFKLKCGRDLSYRVYGAPSAFPVLMFTSVYTSTMADPYLANGAIRHGLKLIYIGRPGLGASTPVAKVTHEGVAEDAAEFVEALDLSRFHIYGSGSASQFALAAAKRFGDRALRMALHAPRFRPPPQDNQTALARFLNIAMAKPWLIDSVAALFDGTRLTSGISWIFSQISSVGSQDDRILHGEGILAFEAAQCADVVQSGLKGMTAELRMLFAGAFEGISPLRLPINAFAGADNKTLTFEDLDANAREHPNFQVTRFLNTGIQYSEAQADEMMRWLARGD